jgi:hypothetical protein
MQTSNIPRPKSHNFIPSLRSFIQRMRSSQRLW